MKKLYISIFLAFLAQTASSQATIQFSGITWNVRNGSGGPGPNLWSDSPNNVWVDAEGQLHLKITKVGSTFYCSEIYAQQSFGYGEYTFYVTSNVENYDPEIVAGLFTYENDTREIDVEFSRWGNPAWLAGWYTVQPVLAGNQQNFALGLVNDSSTHKFTWESNSIFFQSYQGHYAVLPSTENLINEWNYTGSNIPPVGNERLHINFWLFAGHIPVNQMEAELVITSVFVPSTTSVYNKPVVKHMEIFPNPFSDHISIEKPGNTDETIVAIYTSCGKEIFRKTLKGKRTEINLNGLPAGMYFIKCIQNSEFEIQKIIKE